MNFARFSALVIGVWLLPAGLHAAGCGVIKPDATDAVAAAGRFHRVLLENDRVRVIEAIIHPHDHEPPHYHFWQAVFFEQLSPENEPWKKFDIHWSDGGLTKGYVDAAHYRHNLLVEVKGVDCKPAPAAELPATDASRVHDPNMTVVLDNPYARLMKIRVPPGGRQPWHTHTWPAVVVYFHEPATEGIAQDEKTTRKAEVKELEVDWVPDAQPLHSFRNLGSFWFEGYLVELKPLTSIPVPRN